MKKRLLVSTALLFLSVRAVAADDTYARCVDDSDGTNPAWAQCGWAWVEREDARLNAVWKRLFASTEGQTKADLLAEQRAWIGYREKACAYYGNGDWGREGQVISYPTCVAEVIVERTKALESFGER